MMHIILLIIALLLIIIEVFNKNRRRIRIARKNKFEFNHKFVITLDKIISSNKYTKKLRDAYVGKLGVIFSNKSIQNRGIAVTVISSSIIITVLVAITLSLIMSLWYAVLILSILTIYFMNYGFLLYLNFKLKHIHKQFPIALQLFTDSYITSKNIKVAFNESYKEMPKEISTVFEMLARKLSTGHNQKEHILEFANNLNYIWGYAFAEILMLSFEGTGYIEDDLLFLNELISDDIQSNEETKSEMSTNKMLFIVINAFTLVAFVLNIFFSPIAKELYFYTQTGNTLIMAWLGVIALGLGVSTVLDHI